MPGMEASSGMWIAMGAGGRAAVLLSALALQTLLALLATYAIEALRRPTLARDRPAAGGNPVRARQVSIAAEVRPGRFELPRPKRATMPSTLP